VGVNANDVFAVVPLVLNEYFAFSAESEVAVGGEVTSVEEIDIFQDDKGADECGSDGIRVGSEEIRQFLGETIPDKA
jgi:hypothetical protein